MMAAIDPRLRAKLCRRVLDAVLARPRPNARRRAPPLEGAQTVDLAIVGARVHGPVGRGAGARGQAGTRGHGARGRACRVRRERPKRRVLRGVADPRARERARDGSPPRSNGSSRRGGRTSTASPQAIERHGIDCAWEPTGTLVGRDRAPPGAVVPRRGAAAHRVRLRRGVPRSRGGARARSTRRRTSPGSGARTAARCIDPARLAWGLAAAAERLGARIHEQSPVTGDRGRRRRRGRADRAAVACAPAA